MFDMFDAMPVMAAQVKAGTVTPLVVTSAARSAALPGVPTAIEAGVPGRRLVRFAGAAQYAGRRRQAFARRSSRKR